MSLTVQQGLRYHCLFPSGGVGLGLFCINQQLSPNLDGLHLFVTPAPLPALFEIGQQVTNELRMAGTASQTA